MKTKYYFSLTLIAILFFAYSMTLSQILLPNEKGQNVQLYNKSYALIVGEVHYNKGWPALRGVQKDIDAVRESLEKQGFIVFTVIDADHKQIDATYRDFINKYGMDPENRLIFYFAGHGHTIKTSYGEEMGYIVPVDAANPNVDKASFLSYAMTMQQIEVYAKQIQAKHALFLFDACFSGSIFAITRAIPENISYKTGKPVRQFISSGSADETVPDESVFRQQFVSGLDGEADINKDGFITGTELGEFLTEKVINYSRNNQHPQYGKIRNPHLDKGDFVFLSTATKNVDLQEKSLDIATRGVADSRNPVENMPKKSELPWQDEYQDMQSIFAKVAFRTSGGYFLCADNSGFLLADRESVGGLEMFYVIPVADHKIALKSMKGKYLSIADNTEQLKHNKDTAGPTEIFEIVDLDENKIALKAYNGKYITAIEGGKHDVSANRDKILKWEVFDMLKLRHAWLKSFNGYLISAVNGGGDKIIVNGQKQEKNENFEFVKVNKNKIALKSNNGNFLSIENGVANAMGGGVGSNEIFEFIELDNNKFALKANNGRYLTAVGGGGFGLKADADQIGDWQKFELIPDTPRK
ncbi:MAG: caspase family protein [Ignavibacteriae bacterium]|nr:caspase family protein [Ignavibacteriota bacterium]